MSIDDQGFERDCATVVTHFYRGEIGRMMMWRDRLDRTTNWAILGITGLITFSWQQAELSHFFLFFSNAMLYLLLMIEARRYRYYDAYRGRVRVLECHFILPHVARQKNLTQGNWREMLANDLVLPSFKISFWEAIGRRMRRNYVWMYCIVLCAWLGHMSYHSHRSEVTWAENFEQYQPFPIWLFLGTIGLFYAFVVSVFALGFRQRKASGEFQPRSRDNKRKWSL